MALWVDCQNLTASDLLQYDGQLSSVVSSEGIDVDSKSLVAHEQISSIVASRFLFPGGGSASQLAERIVVTAPLRRWHALLTLEAIYREAYFRHLSERHKLRAEYLSAQAKQAMDAVFESGLGLCGSPIRRAPQIELSLTAGNIPPGVWHVSVTFAKNGSEGEGSEVSSVIVTEPSSICVQVGAAAADSLMHVYAGASPERLYRQTTAPVAAGSAFLLPAIHIDGPTLGWGQAPDRILRTDRRILRG